MSQWIDSPSNLSFQVYVQSGVFRCPVHMGGLAKTMLKFQHGWKSPPGNSVALMKTEWDRAVEYRQDYIDKSLGIV